MKQRSGPRLNWVELILFGLLIGMMAFGIGVYYTFQRARPFLSRESAELQVLQSKYGPARNTRYGEEWIIRDFFQGQRNGVFADVGANHHQEENNTYYLETALEWRGVAIEPQTKFAAGYRHYRPNTLFVPLFVSDRSNEKAVLFVPDNDLVASTSKAFIAKEGFTDSTPMEVNTTTLDDVLTRAGLERLDFLSIDVELHEPQVLRGFSIDRWQPRLICIEAHPEVRQEILDYFRVHEYSVVGKYLRADTTNLWFTRSSK